ncbi:hypothetical protein D3C75_1005250 [compost metagenome]
MEHLAAPLVSRVPNTAQGMLLYAFFIDAFKAACRDIQPDILRGKGRLLRKGPKAFEPEGRGEHAESAKGVGTPVGGQRSNESAKRSADHSRVLRFGGSPVMGVHIGLDPVGDFIDVCRAMTAKGGTAFLQRFGGPGRVVVGPAGR